jgi:hypothetical protein
VGDGIIVEQADQFVLEARQPHGAAAAVAVGFELQAGGTAGCLDERLQPVEDGGPRFRGAAVRIEQRRQRVAHFVRLEVRRGRKT